MKLITLNSELNWLFNNSNTPMNNSFSFRGTLKSTMSRNIRGFLQTNSIQNHFGMGYFFSYNGFDCEYRELENGQSVFIKTRAK